MRKKNNGFTIIELLGVIVILGVISLIAIGSYYMYISKATVTAYDAAEKSMKEATNGVFTDCMINNNNSFLCSLYNAPKKDESRVVYVEDLIQGQYMDRIKDPEQQGEFCDSLKSYILVNGNNKTGSDNNNLSYKSCLYCANYKSSDCDFNLVAGKDFGIKINTRINDISGADYFSEFTKENIWLNVTSFDPYQVGIKSIEYATNTSGPWTTMINGTMIWTREGITKLMFRVTDNANNVSSPTSVYVKIDRTAPTADFDIKGSLGSNNWHTSDVSIGVKNQSDGDGSGVLSAKVDTSAIRGNTTASGKVVNMEVSDLLGNTRNYQVVVKIDKTIPTVGDINLTGTMGANNWYTSNVEVTATGGSSGPSGFKNNLSHTSITSNTTGVTVTLTTTAGNGLKATTSRSLKVDKNTPIPGNINLSGTKGANNWYTSNVGITTSGGISGPSGFVSTLSHAAVTYNTSGVTVTLTATAGNGLKATKTAAVKVDKTVPKAGTIKLLGTMGNNNWYVSDVGISASGGTSGPSGFTNSLSHTLINKSTTGATITLTTTAGNGFKAYATTSIKVDKESPVVTMNTGITNIMDPNKKLYLEKYSISGGSTVCTNTSFGNKVNNSQDLYLGLNRVSCVATGNNGKNATNVKEYEMSALNIHMKSTPHYLQAKTYNNGSFYQSGNSVILQSDSKQYGPYIKASKGCYQVKYTGNNLNAGYVGTSEESKFTNIYRSYEHQPLTEGRITKLNYVSGSSNYFVKYDINLVGEGFEAALYNRPFGPTPNLYDITVHSLSIVYMSDPAKCN